MLPQHGGIPNFSMRLSGAVLLLLSLVLVTGLMISLSLYTNADPGDTAAHSQIKLSLIITFLLSFFILLVGTNRWWYPHLWKHGNSQRQHRHRRGRSTSHRRHTRHRS